MRIDRRVVRRKDQYLIPIPAEIRHQLGLVAGARIWWHTGQKGMAAVTNTGRVVRGRLKLDADCPSCAGYRKEIASLRAKLPAQRQSAWTDAWRHYAMKELSVNLKGLPVIEAINERLRDIQDRLPALTGNPAGARRRRRTAAVRAIEDHVNGCETCLVALVDHTPGAAPCAFYSTLEAEIAAMRTPTRRRAAPHVQSPDPPPSPGVVEEGADTSGAQLPGVPLEH
jgi:hypothetical protein